MARHCLSPRPRSSPQYRLLPGHSWRRGEHWTWHSQGTRHCFIHNKQPKPGCSLPYMETHSQRWLAASFTHWPPVKGVGTTAPFKDHNLNLWMNEWHDCLTAKDRYPPGETTGPSGFYLWFYCSVIAGATRHNMVAMFQQLLLMTHLVVYIWIQM